MSSLGVVGAHLLLVDVLLEDVAQNVRVDLVVLAVGPLIQVPAVAVEEVEDPLEGLVGNADVRVVPFQVVNVEQAAIEERDLAQQGGEVGRSLSFGLPEPLVEEAQQEDAVELLEAPLATAVPDHAQAVAEVVVVTVEEAPLLDEVDEHHAVEHQGGVPVPVALRGDAVDEFSKAGQLGLEALVEALGHLPDIQGLADFGRNCRDIES